MSRFCKRPVVIEAVQITAGHFDDPHPNPDHIEGVVYDPIERCVLISTLEGTMKGNVGDWIIRGLAGELYPCKPDIFEATYEPEETSEPARLMRERDALRDLLHEFACAGVERDAGKYLVIQIDHETMAEARRMTR